MCNGYVMRVVQIVANLVPMLAGQSHKDPTVRSQIDVCNLTFFQDSYHRRKRKSGA